ncbi:MAG: HAD family hydrolase [Gammaproteobacteria bacterium]|nr:HAD family hydrolase [Gammaproteobacteria bacterium]
MATRIAMWSGPRNISTAMMRSWENRKDTVVWDEPFYGHYLHKTGIPHPGAEEVIADQGTDWKTIASQCSGDPNNGAPIFYQKHMTMHLLPEMDRSWLTNVTNCFLIRSPEEVVSSYSKVRGDLTLDDLGFIQQAALFDLVIKMSSTIPIVIDAADFLTAPEEMQQLVCEKLAIPFRTEMIAWPQGQRDSDGVWAKYWYNNVWESTSFQEYTPRNPTLTKEQRDIADAAQPYYDMLHQFRLTV